MSDRVGEMKDTMTHVPNPLDGLDPQQYEAVVAPRGPVCVLAGAGTGKTRTITHRIAYLVREQGYPAQHILAVTFTTKAAGEMRHRLASLGAAGVPAATFHAAALRQLRYFWPTSVGGEIWPLLDKKLRLIRTTARRVGISTDLPVLRDVASEIEWAKASLLLPADYEERAAALGRKPAIQPGLIAKAYDVYEELKTAAAVLDFDDLLLHMSAILAADENAARTFRSQYRSFVVDEYQDVTPLQQQLIDTWLGGRDELTVVGDANQTIYSFAGASHEPLLQFGTKYPGATIIRLQRNYRSTPQVIAVANRLIAADDATPRHLRLALQPVIADGQTVRFAEYDDEPSEVTAVVEQIGALLQAGTPAANIAILYRINAQSQPFEQALAAAGISFVVRGGAEFFTRAEVQQALRVLLQTAAEPGRAHSDDGAENILEPSLVTQVKDLLEPLGLSKTAPAPGAVRERWEGLSAIVAMAEETLAAHAQADLRDFAQKLKMRSKSQHTPTLDAVTLASLHAAKGLEWHTVFLVGLTEGMVPINHAVTDEQIAEELRLLYVGVTRARQQLRLSWALSRHVGGRKSRRMSRFLTAVAPRATLPSSPKKRRRGRCYSCGGPLIAAAERKLGRCAQCPSTADPTLIAALQQWRRQRAIDDEVPAYVVFSNATLTAIAERRPHDAATLLQVPGVGRTKLERYGRDVLNIIAATR